MDTLAAQEDKHRLIVLVPGGMGSSTDLARNIHQMAVRENRDILYLMLVEDEAQALTVSRNMATMKAVTAGAWVVVQTQQAEASRWLEALRAVTLPGDVVVCQAEHTVQTGAFRKSAVREQIDAQLKVPVRVISGLYRQQHVERRSPLREWNISSGLITIIALFAWLEFQLSRSISSAAGKLIIIIVLFLVFGALLTWDRITY